MELNYTWELVAPYWLCIQDSSNEISSAKNIREVLNEIMVKVNDPFFFGLFIIYKDNQEIWHEIKIQKFTPKDIYPQQVERFTIHSLGLLESRKASMDKVIEQHLMS